MFIVALFGVILLYYILCGLVDVFVVPEILVCTGRFNNCRFINRFTAMVASNFVYPLDDKHLCVYS